MIYRMTRKAYDDLPIRPVKPQNLYSTDDTECYVFEGKEKNDYLLGMLIYCHSKFWYKIKIQKR